MKPRVYRGRFRLEYCCICKKPINIGQSYWQHKLKFWHILCGDSTTTTTTTLDK